MNELEAATGRRTRVGAYALCTDGDSRMLLTRLSVTEVDIGAWTLPGGGVEFGEHPDAAVIRELEEETGLIGEIDELAAVFSHVYSRSRAANGDDMHFLGLLYRVRIVGGELRDETNGSSDAAAWLSREEIAERRLVEISRFGVDLVFGAVARPADRVR